jgi:4-hydroxy-2-oxoheptanedioate aldolase
LAELEYPANYRDNLLVAVIVETRRGFENVREIAAVDGIDMVVLGAGDLMADIAEDFAALTKLGTYNNSELDRLMAEVEAIVRSTPDCWLGGVSRNAVGGRELFAKGYDFVLPAADGWLLTDAARSIITAMRG